VLAGHNPTLVQLACVLGAGLAIGLAVAIVGAAIVSLVRGSRRTAIWSGVIAYVLLVAVGVVASVAAKPAPDDAAFQPPATPASGPNIILLVMDALRADYLPLFSEEAVAETPRLEAFAGDAVKFQNTFSHASWTKPSFATIFSGLYPEGHTATAKTSSLPGEVKTFPELLTGGGYYTKGLANNPNITAIFNFHQGFVDYVDLKPDLMFWASPSSSKLSLYSVLRKVRERIEAGLPWSSMAVTDFYQPAESVTRTTLDWLDGDERPEETPFFLFVHYMDTHDPFMDWENPGVGYARARMESPNPDEDLEPMKRAYNLEIEYLDKHLGALFDGLRERGLYDDSLIIFTADHGEEFYDHDGWWHGQTLFDELIHIPLLVKLPGNAMAGQVNLDLARHIDLGPTILQFAGTPKADTMTGQSLFVGVGAFGNGETAYVYAENDFEGNDLQAVRTMDAKVIRANEGNPREHAPVELYDLAADPGETTNLAGQNDVREGTLLKVLDDMQAHIQENAAEPMLLEGTPEELEEQLGALGYLE